MERLKNRVDLKGGWGMERSKHRVDARAGEGMVPKMIGMTTVMTKIP